MLKEKMTHDEMLQYLKYIGHDTFYFDTTIVKEIATTDLGYVAEMGDNEIVFIKR